MTIWVDGDSFPRKGLTIILEAVQQRPVRLEIVADRLIPRLEDYTGMAKSNVNFTLVPHSSGDTDEVILQNAHPKDLVATRDLHLSDALLSKNIQVINDRGKIWTQKDLKRRMEDSVLMQAMRTGGIVQKQGNVYGAREAISLSQALQKILPY